jgi:hypothetical protein
MPPQPRFPFSAQKKVINSGKFFIKILPTSALRTHHSKRARFIPSFAVPILQPPPRLNIFFNKA